MRAMLYMPVVEVHVHVRYDDACDGEGGGGMGEGVSEVG